MAESFKVGSAPWEQENAGPGTFPVGSAPWETNSQSAGEKILNEAHPDVSLGSRLMFKNFGADTNSGIKYLTRENPGLEFKTDKSGEIIARKPGETQWKKLDPSGINLTSIAGIKEAGRDIGDVAFDIPAGVAQGAATAGAGIMAAPTIVGALPAAAAAGAASGAGLEGIRQGIGRLAGVNEEFDPTQIGIAGGAGAISPLLLGTGGTAAQAAKAALKTGASEAAILSAQRGAIGRGYDATANFVGPRLGEMASGINKDVIETAKKYLPDLRKADTSPDVVVDNLRQAQEKIVSGLKSKTTSAGKTMENVVSQLDDAGTKISTDSILSPVNAIKAKIEKEGIDSAAKKELLNDVQGTINKYFSVEKKGLVMDPVTLELKEQVSKEIPKEITAGQANSMYFELKELAKKYGFDYGDIGTSSGALGGVNRSDARIASAFKDAAGAAKDQIKSAAAEHSDELAETYAKANADYGTFAAFRDEFNNASKSEESFSRFLQKVSRDPIYKQSAQELSKETGVNIRETMLKNEAFKKFTNPAKDVLSLGGSTSTSRTIPLAIAGGAAGYAVGQSSGGEYSPYLSSMLGAAVGSKAGSPAALRKIMELNKAARSSQLPGKAAINSFWTKMAQEENK